MIRAIAAIDDNRGISSNGNIPWDIPEDTQYYKEHTLNSIIIMGRNTYDGFTEPLASRRNLVMSYSLQSVRPGFELISNVEEFLHKVQEDVWIIGGAGPYEALLLFCDELYLTHVRGDFNCDRFFPDYRNEFSLASESELQHSGEYAFSYAVYRRI